MGSLSPPRRVDVRKYNALHLSQPTNFRAILKSREIIWGTWCHIPHEEAARIVAHLPYDFCFIDGEHTPLGPTTFASLIRAIQFYSCGSMIPIARCTTPELVNHALNAGAGGIVMPHIQTKEQAENLVRLVKFPPRGDRSVPPWALIGRGKETPAGKSTLDVWDEHVAVFCQIEDTVGVQNAEEIARVPGVDAIMVGGYDLSASLGLTPGAESLHQPKFLEAIKKIQRAADANGLAVLGGAMPDTVADRIKLGWRAFLCATDASLIIQAGTETLNLYRSIAEDSK